MFTENEVAALLNFPGILEEVTKIKQKFIAEEAEFLEIEEHDFLSLILLTPSIGVALSNGSVSLFEEMALNKKARKLSKGGYWMKTDPVVFAMEHLIKGYDKWSPVFYAHIKKLMHATINVDVTIDSNFNIDTASESDKCVQVLKSPFILIRFLTSFFMNDEEEDILAKQKIAQIEYDRITEIAQQLGLTNLPVYQIYHSKLIIK
ncbi:MAG: hypothetical protein L3J06_00170 [Cyclobacteriaceae bacterium]|nr:hypothetical protein [Cyclobacteriaceae bacterium]